MKRQVVKVVLNADRPEDKQIRDYFLYASEPMSKAFKTAMTLFIKNQDTSSRDDLQLAAIRKIIREELQNMAMVPPDARISQPVTSENGEDDVSPLDFLEQLEAMATI